MKSILVFFGCHFCLTLFRYRVCLTLSEGGCATGLEVAGQMRGDETVLVTAAAGGTGQFVVQLAKAAGNHVVATCGGSEKAALLKKLGADRVSRFQSCCALYLGVQAAVSVHLSPKQHTRSWGMTCHLLLRYML